MSENKSIILPEITDFLENYGFNVDCYENYIEIQQYTPAGEDWNLTLILNKDSTVKDFIGEIESLYEGFDVDEEVKLWIDGAGKNGVPNARGLVEDNEWKDSLLKTMSEDKSLERLFGLSAYVDNDLSETLEKRAFTLDESSLELYASNECAEWLVEVFTTADKSGRDFYDDIYERAGLNNLLELYFDGNIKVPKSFETLKEVIGFEDSTIDVYARVFKNKEVSLYVILKDNDGLGTADRDVLLSEEEQKKAYEIIERCVTAKELQNIFDRLTDFHMESETEYATELNKFQKENFYDEADIILTYMKNAPLQEIIDFTEKPNITMRNYMQAVNDVIACTGITTLKNYAEKYLPELYENNIKGEKYYDNTERQKKETKTTTIERE